LKPIALKLGAARPSCRKSPQNYHKNIFLNIGFSFSPGGCWAYFLIEFCSLQGLT